MVSHAVLRALLVVTAAATMVVAAVASTGGDAARIAAERRVWRVVTEHINALNACNVRRLMAQHPSNVLFLFPGGMATRGRDAIEAMYKAVCVPRSAGGLAPFRFHTLSADRVGTSLFVRWRFTSAALARPYEGADAYATVGNQLVRVVSTFDGADLELRRT